jgi:hypothetical protein
LGLDGRQIADTKALMADFSRNFSELERSHSFLTNRLPNGEKSGEFPALITKPFAAEAKAAAERFLGELAAVMGRERAELYWSPNTLESGSRERIRILTRFKGNDMPFIEEYDQGHMTHGVSFEDLPEEFKPFAADWRPKPKP